MLKAYKKITLWITLCVSFIGLLLIMSSKITTIFNVIATTERIEFIIVDNNHSSWNFDGVNLLDLNGKIIKTNFSGTINLLIGNTVRIDRYGNGPAYISIQNIEDLPIGKVSTDEGRILECGDKSFIEIVIDNINSKSNKGITHTLPIKGFVTLGGDVDYEINGEAPAVLKNGTINMQGFSTFRKDNFFPAGEEHLKLGDELRFDNNELAVGFAHIGEISGIEVSYRVEAKEATIIKSGPVKNGYKISATLLDELLNDRLFQTISIFCGFLLVLTTLLSSILDLYKYFNGK